MLIYSFSTIGFTVVFIHRAASEMAEGARGGDFRN